MDKADVDDNAQRNGLGFDGSRVKGPFYLGTGSLLSKSKGRRNITYPRSLET